MFGAAEMNALQEMCRDPEEDTALRPSQSAVVQRIGPNAAAATDGDDSTKENAPDADPKAIWADDEIPPEEALRFVDSADDARKRATFEMLYKQDVTTEDVYLGTEKNPSSAHCNAIARARARADGREPREPRGPRAARRTPAPRPERPMR